MGNQIIIINSSEASWDQTISFGISQLYMKFCLRHVADEYMMNVKLRPAPTRANAIFGYPCVMVRNGISSLYFFSVNKWNRFQNTSRLQKKLVWFSCGGGGGGVYIVSN